MKGIARAAACLTLGGTVLAIDLSPFEPVTFKNFQRHQPAAGPGREWIFDASMPALAVVVTYAGAIREIDPATTERIRSIGRSIRQPEFAALYSKEIEVVEQGRSYRLPVQDEVLAHFVREVRKGQEFTAYVRYMGSSAGPPERLYLLIDYDANPPKPLPRDACFSKSLFGITVGTPLAPVLKGLAARYGEPRPMRRGQQNYYLFVIEPSSKTYAIIGDAGEGYRNRVFSVQVAGLPTSTQAILGALRFGAPESEVEAALGRPKTAVESGEGFTRLEMPGSVCSVEIRDGGLASILITDDPNYFAE